MILPLVVESWILAAIWAALPDTPVPTLERNHNPLVPLLEEPDQ
ncbi:hypothetical protein STA3757_18920 [Stanieria sp. NIES-3757]|nr:hypothetical protein STA3757_18920 [Stanieria sp. NIES-3757]